MADELDYETLIHMRLVSLDDSMDVAFSLSGVEWAV